MPEMLTVNPAKRKTKRKTTKKRTTRRPGRRKNPVAALSNPKKRGSRRGRRRNPSARGFNFNRVLKDQIMPAAIAGGGAVGLDLIYGYLPIPDTLKMGPLRHLVKGAAAVGLGAVAGMVVKPDTAKAIGMGALTTVFHAAYRDVIGQFAPGLALGVYEGDVEMGYVSPAITMEGAGALGWDEDEDLEGLAEYEDISGLAEYEDISGLLAADDDYDEF